MEFYGILLCFILIITQLQSTLGNVSNDDVTYKWGGRTYKLIYHAEPWGEAKELCETNGAKLAVPKSEEEFNFLRSIVRSMHYPSVVGSNYKLLVWLGINNLDDMRTWKNIDGENFQNSTFHAWAGEDNNDISDSPAEPHCGGMDAANYGIRKFWCHLRQPFICCKTSEVSTTNE